MKFSITFILIFLGPCVAFASDESVGRVSDILRAVERKEYGRVFIVPAHIITPLEENTNSFGVRDSDDAILIRRGNDWPTDKFFIGDEIRLRCEISATASQPVGAFFRDMTLVARHPDYKAPRNVLISTGENDAIKVTNLPTFLTPTTVLASLGGLIILAILILLWTTSLRVLVDRKSRALLKEQLKHVKAELKTEERTRLAIELHDSLAQTLTGVALEIDTADKLSKEGGGDMRNHIGTASRTLKSCRDELRNCLWDLRNRALEERDFDTAIRQTLAPHIGKTDLAIRFNVPRSLLSDNTTHTLLRIIRELTLNGIQHGHATKIWIAGALDGDMLRFSVRDNGCGFDVDNAPGFKDGHYGLLGIRERIDALEGEFLIASTSKSGTKATISIRVPKETPNV